MFDYVEYTKRKFREALEKGMYDHFVIGHVVGRKREFLGKVVYIQLCEHSVRDQDEITKWMTRIEIRPEGVYYVKDARLEDVKVIDEILDSEWSEVRFCVNVIAVRGNVTVLRLFEDFFVAPTTLLLEENVKKHVWISNESLLTTTPSDLTPLDAESAKGVAFNLL